MTILKGVQLAPFCYPATLKEAVDFGCRIVRYQMYANPKQFPTMTEWIGEIRHHVTYLQSDLLPVLKGTRTKLILCIMAQPNGLEYHDVGEVFVNLWKYIATTFKDEKQILGYDILNEPRLSRAMNLMRMRQCYDEIRPINKNKVVIMSTVDGNPEIGFGLELSTYKDPKLWLTVHMYSPMKLTHVGTPGYITRFKYPNETKKWNKAFLKEQLLKLRHYEVSGKLGSSKIYIGEFSCSNVVDRASRTHYIKDCISIFNEYGWHWSYHAYDEAPIWEPKDGVLKILKREWKK